MAWFVKEVINLRQVKKLMTSVSYTLWRLTMISVPYP